MKYLTNNYIKKFISYISNRFNTFEQFLGRPNSWIKKENSR
jgi:hypothetical protein